ncbi:MAG: methyltransferase domain-containing protein [Acidobacteriia bacterium]|nr:methyltransferase domain-containing protein [Terriglobia bacterium]
MKQRLMDYLVCPLCAGGLDLRTGAMEGAEIMEGGLDCASCHRRYPIVRGVPRLLPETFSEEQRATADAFGYEWTHFSELEDTYEAEFLDWIHPIGKEFFRGKLVLDGGCGKGRHVALSAAFGAAEVMGIDISDAVDAAFANTRHLPNAHIVQADIYHVPLKPVFEYAFSIGVLHHLPEPKAGFLSLAGRLAPGGRISAWVYGEEGNWWITHLVSPLRTVVTSRLPRAMTKAIAFAIAVPMQATLKLLYRPVNQRAPRLKRLLFYNDYLYSISGFSFRENYSTVFDHLVAPTAFYISRPEFEAWFREAKLDGVNITWRNCNSWRGTAVAAAAATAA